MSNTKHALIRYKILDKCFRNTGKKYYIDDLIEACNVKLAEIDPDSDGISRRTIFDDISFMESAEGWLIDLDRHKDGRKVYYRYRDTDFSIDSMPLNETEILQLKSAMDILSQFKGMPQFEWVNEMLPKINSGMEVSEEKKAVIDFDSNAYLRGIEYLGELYSAILYKKVLLITYKPFRSEDTYQYKIHPYYLKQHNNRWFLFGYNPKEDKYNWNLALDRMISIIEVKEHYHENDQIDWTEYFEDIYGVTKPDDGKLEDIVLHCYGKTGNYILTKPLHGSQKANWIEDTVLEVRLKLIINFEFERLILSYGPNVKVVSPSSFQSQIVRCMQQGLSLYDGIDG